MSNFINPCLVKYITKEKNEDKNRKLRLQVLWVAPGAKKGVGPAMVGLSDSAHEVRAMLTEESRKEHSAFTSTGLTGGFLQINEYQLVINETQDHFVLLVSQFKMMGSEGSDVVGDPIDIMRVPAVMDVFNRMSGGPHRAPVRPPATSTRPPTSSRRPNRAAFVAHTNTIPLTRLVFIPKAQEEALCAVSGWDTTTDTAYHLLWRRNFQRMYGREPTANPGIDKSSPRTQPTTARTKPAKSSKSSRSSNQNARKRAPRPDSLPESQFHSQIFGVHSWDDSVPDTQAESYTHTSTHTHAHTHTHPFVHTRTHTDAYTRERPGVRTQRHTAGEQGDTVDKHGIPARSTTPPHAHAHAHAHARTHMQSQTFLSSQGSDNSFNVTDSSQGNSSPQHSGHSSPQTLSPPKPARTAPTATDTHTLTLTHTHTHAHNSNSNNNNTTNTNTNKADTHTHTSAGASTRGRAMNKPRAKAQPGRAEAARCMEDHSRVKRREHRMGRMLYPLSQVESLDYSPQEPLGGHDSPPPNQSAQTLKAANQEARKRKRGVSPFSSMSESEMLASPAAQKGRPVENAHTRTHAQAHTSTSTQGDVLSTDQQSTRARRGTPQASKKKEINRRRTSSEMFGTLSFENVVENGSDVSGHISNTHMRANAHTHTHTRARTNAQPDIHAHADADKRAGATTHTAQASARGAQEDSPPQSQFFSSQVFSPTRGFDADFSVNWQDTPPAQKVPREQGKTINQELMCTTDRSIAGHVGSGIPQSDLSDSSPLSQDCVSSGDEDALNTSIHTRHSAHTHTHTHTNTHTRRTTSSNMYTHTSKVPESASVAEESEKTAEYRARQNQPKSRDRDGQGTRPITLESSDGDHEHVATGEYVRGQTGTNTFTEARASTSTRVREKTCEDASAGLRGGQPTRDETQAATTEGRDEGHIAGTHTGTYTAAEPSKARAPVDVNAHSHSLSTQCALLSDGADDFSASDEEIGITPVQARATQGTRLPRVSGEDQPHSRDVLLSDASMAVGARGKQRVEGSLEEGGARDGNGAISLDENASGAMSNRRAQRTSSATLGQSDRNNSNSTHTDKTPAPEKTGQGREEPHPLARDQNIPTHPRTRHTMGSVDMSETSHTTDDKHLTHCNERVSGTQRGSHTAPTGPIVQVQDREGDGLDRHAGRTSAGEADAGNARAHQSETYAVEVTTRSTAIPSRPCGLDRSYVIGGLDNTDAGYSRDGCPQAEPKGSGRGLDNPVELDAEGTFTKHASQPIESQDLFTATQQPMRCEDFFTSTPLDVPVQGASESHLHTEKGSQEELSMMSGIAVKKEASAEPHHFDPLSQDMPSSRSERLVCPAHSTGRRIKSEGRDANIKEEQLSPLIFKASHANSAHGCPSPASMANERDPLDEILTHTQLHAQTHAHTLTQTHAHTRTHILHSTHMPTRMDIHRPEHTHTHTHTHTPARRGGVPKCSAEKGEDPEDESTMSPFTQSQPSQPSSKSLSFDAMDIQAGQRPATSPALRQSFNVSGIASSHSQPINSRQSNHQSGKHAASQQSGVSHTSHASDDVSFLHINAGQGKPPQHQSGASLQSPSQSHTLSRPHSSTHRVSGEVVSSVEYGSVRLGSVPEKLESAHTSVRDAGNTHSGGSDELDDEHNAQVIPDVLDSDISLGNPTYSGGGKKRLRPALQKKGPGMSLNSSSSRLNSSLSQLNSSSSKLNSSSSQILSQENDFRANLKENVCPSKIKIGSQDGLGSSSQKEGVASQSSGASSLAANQKASIVDLSNQKSSRSQSTKEKAVNPEVSPNHAALYIDVSSQLKAPYSQESFAASHLSQPKALSSHTHGAEKLSQAHYSHESGVSDQVFQCKATFSPEICGSSQTSQTDLIAAAVTAVHVIGKPTALHPVQKKTEYETTHYTDETDRHTGGFNGSNQGIQSNAHEQQHIDNYNNNTDSIQGEHSNVHEQHHTDDNNNNTSSNQGVQSIVYEQHHTDNNNTTSSKQGVQSIVYERHHTDGNNNNTSSNQGVLRNVYERNVYERHHTDDNNNNTSSNQGVQSNVYEQHHKDDNNNTTTSSNQGVHSNVHEQHHTDDNNTTTTGSNQGVQSNVHEQHHTDDNNNNTSSNQGVQSNVYEQQHTDNGNTTSSNQGVQSMFHKQFAGFVDDIRRHAQSGGIYTEQQDGASVSVAQAGEDKGSRSSGGSNGGRNIGEGSSCSNSGDRNTGGDEGPMDNGSSRQQGKSGSHNNNDNNTKSNNNNNNNNHNTNNNDYNNNSNENNNNHNNNNNNDNNNNHNNTNNNNDDTNNNHNNSNNNNDDDTNNHNNNDDNNSNHNNSNTNNGNNPTLSDDNTDNEGETAQDNAGDGVGDDRSTSDDKAHKDQSTKRSLGNLSSGGDNSSPRLKKMRAHGSVLLQNGPGDMVSGADGSVADGDSDEGSFSEEDDDSIDSPPPAVLHNERASIPVPTINTSPVVQEVIQGKKGPENSDSRQPLQRQYSGSSFELSDGETYEDRTVEDSQVGPQFTQSQHPPTVNAIDDENSFSFDSPSPTAAAAVVGVANVTHTTRTSDTNMTRTTGTSKPIDGTNRTVTSDTNATVTNDTDTTHTNDTSKQAKPKVIGIGVGAFPNAHRRTGGPPPANAGVWPEVQKNTHTESELQLPVRESGTTHTHTVEHASTHSSVRRGVLRVGEGQGRSPAAQDESFELSQESDPVITTVPDSQIGPVFTQDTDMTVRSSQNSHAQISVSSSPNQAPAPKIRVIGTGLDLRNLSTDRVQSETHLSAQTNTTTQHTSETATNVTTHTNTDAKTNIHMADTTRADISSGTRTQANRKRVSDEELGRDSVGSDRHTKRNHKHSRVRGDRDVKTHKQARTVKTPIVKRAPSPAMSVHPKDLYVLLPSTCRPKRDDTLRLTLSKCKKKAFAYFIHAEDDLFFDGWPDDSDGYDSN